MKFLASVVALAIYLQSENNYYTANAFFTNSVNVRIVSCAMSSTTDIFGKVLFWCPLPFFCLVPFSLTISIPSIISSRQNRHPRISLKILHNPPKHIRPTNQRLLHRRVASTAHQSCHLQHPSVRHLKVLRMWILRPRRSGGDDYFGFGLWGWS